VIARWSAIVVLFAAAAFGAELTPQQQRGKQLYLKGESAANRPVTALLGGDDVEVPASVVPCASCHGRDGRGRAEGGIRPSNIQWDVLLHAATTDDRTRAPYTRSQLKRAITMGIDSVSKPLENTMPRYRMAIEDIEDLLSYLEKVGDDYAPGVSEDAVRIGVVLPARADEQAAVRRTLEGYFARVNKDGGIFGRRLDARFATSAGSADERAASLAGFIEREQPFAIGAAWLSGADAAMSEAAERAHVPTIAAFAAHAPPEDRYVFRLLAGVREQSMALIAAAKPEPDARIAIVADQSSAATAAQLREDLAGGKYTHVELVQTVPAGAELVLFIGAPSQLSAILQQAAALPSPPRMLIPVAHSAGDLTAAPVALDGRILVALPSSPEDANEQGAAELRALAVPDAHATACRLALASAHLLVEALRLSGRDLDRDDLVKTLETFYREPTTLTPPITWAPNQHTGTRAARIAAIDLREKRWLDRGWWSAAP
jgi:ABC-type branched-subunit amino acid transport system substrate-binding protein